MLDRFLFSDLSQFLHVGFILVNKHCPVFFRWFALCFREITCAKNSVFLAASFGDLLLNEKQNLLFRLTMKSVKRSVLV